MSYYSHITMLVLVIVLDEQMTKLCSKKKMIRFIIIILYIINIL